MTTLIFIRHGESEANIKKIFAGHLDVDLTNRGYEQAELTARYIKENYDVEKIYSSDLLRAYHTAKVISKHCNLQIERLEDLREINAGDWQGKKFDVLQTDYIDSYGIWLNDIGSAMCPNGESVKRLYDRIWAAVLKIVEKNKEKTVVVVTHATPIRVVCCRLKGLRVNELKNVPWVANASLSEVSIEDDKWILSKESVDNYLSDMRTVFPANV